MKEVVSDPGLVAYCGLYCGACRAHLAGRCPGCHQNEKATWCKIRTCCQENGYTTCADCLEHQDPNQCRRFNNLIAKIFGLVFRSDRAACVSQIRALGVQGHADQMAAARQHTIRR
jgi:hypothetical protein